VTRHRPYDQAAERDRVALEVFMGRAQAFLAACKALGWHLGIAMGSGPVECPTCGTPWPCTHQK
jgi:hypothetical protein